MAATKFDPTTPPTEVELEKAGEIIIKDEQGKDVKLGELWDKEKTIVIWIRHFYCGLCQDYISFLTSKVTPAQLSAAGTKLVIIGCGSYELIKPYRDLLQTPFPIYADSTKATYTALGMTLRTLDKGSVTAEYLRGGFVTNVFSSIRNAFKIGVSFSAKAGDIKQLGGEFVLGPGPKATYTHRMENTQGHAPLAELLKAAGVENGEVKSESVPVQEPVSKTEVDGAGAVASAGEGITA